MADPDSGPVQEVGVLIVGAGPYGIALALELHRLGVPFAVCGEPFKLWLHHTLPSAALRSDARTSEVYSHDDRFAMEAILAERYGTVEARRICRERIPVSLYREYLQRVCERLPFAVQRELIEQLTRTDSGFAARTSRGSVIHSTQVVLACGPEPHQRLPRALASITPDRVIHGWDTERYQALSQKRVLVVGSGQSAAEAIAHLLPHNEVTWVYRTAPIFWADPIHLPAPIFRLLLHASTCFRWLPSAPRRWLARLFTGSTITPDLEAAVFSTQVDRIECDIDGLALVDVGSEIQSRKLERSFDRVVACTGYRTSFANLRFLAPELAAATCCQQGFPELDRNYETSARGVFAIGSLAEPRHGPAQRFVMGSQNAAIAVSRVLARRHEAS
ncbi:MAG: NAD(P)-binding domain-containing protein [Planctomycetota bacterium]